MKRPIRACVKCGAVLNYRSIVTAGPFPCPVCGTRLQASEAYGQWTGWGGVLVSALVFAAMGLRGLRLVCAVLVAFVPVLFVTVNYLKYLIPPKIEIYLPEDATLNLRDGPRS